VDSTSISQVINALMIFNNQNFYETVYRFYTNQDKIQRKIREKLFRKLTIIYLLVLIDIYSIVS